MDEEHDYSYYQENFPSYHCRDIALKINKAVTVLFCSATPSIEIYYQVQQKKIYLHSLKHRFLNYTMPKIKIYNQDLELLSQNIINITKEHLQTGNKIIFFLNRRGYAPYIICKKCTITLKCYKCNNFLTYYKQAEIIQCNKCLIKINNCYICKADSFNYQGLGIEKLYEQLQIILPQCNIKYISSDTEQQKIQLLKFDILIGTQIISKGHDFKNISLIVFLSLYDKSDDFRINELLVQNIFQLSGRAGRDGTKSEIIIQTNHTRKQLFNFILENNYISFIEAELAKRQLFNLSPYYLYIALYVNKYQRLYSIYNRYKNLNFQVRIVYKNQKYYLLFKLFYIVYEKTLQTIYLYCNKQNIIPKIYPYLY